MADRDPEQLARNGAQDVAETDRLVLLAQLVYAIALLHEHGWVYGDLSFKNAAFALSPPRMILLDCDGAAYLHNPHREQAHSLGWEPPECAQRNVQDKATDVYKLGLAILRCLNPGRGAATMRTRHGSGASSTRAGVDADRASAGRRPGTAADGEGTVRLPGRSRAGPLEVHPASSRPAASPSAILGRDPQRCPEW